MTNYKKNSAGWSLIELMVIFSIIILLTTFSISVYQNYKARAKQSEAKINVKSLASLKASFTHEDSGLVPDLFVTLNDYSSPTSCHTNNPYGFKVSDCRRINYIYASPGNSFAIAIEGFDNVGKKTKVFPYCDSNIDIWTSNSTSLKHPGDPEKRCGECFIDRMEDVLNNNQATPLDMNGDDFVHDDDITLIVTAIATYPHIQCN